MNAMNQPANPTPIAPDQTSEPSHPEEGIIFNARRVTQAVVLIASAICFWMFWIVGEWIDFPVEYKHSGSVLYQHNGVLKLIVFWVLLIAVTVAGTLLTSWRWFLAGLFSACLGSSAWAIRGGTLRYVLFTASSPSVFLVLAIEQILLVGGVAALWLVLWQLQESQRSLLAEQRPKIEEETTPGDPIFAITTQALAMGILVLLLAATDMAKQVNLSVFIAAAAATALAQSLQKGDKLGKWYWAGPILVGLIGYVGCYFSSRGWDIGQPSGTLGPLARPLPMCYASFGMAGALFGYWTSESTLTVLAITSLLSCRRENRIESKP
jgi:hypothetical protein